MEGAVPGGVTDREGDNFYVRLAGGELVAVALADGSVRWRRAAAPRPVAAAADHLLAVDDRAHGLEFVLLKAADGTELARFEAGEGTAAGDEIEASIDEAPDGPTISWRAEPRYRGGASPHILASTARRSATGAVFVDAASGAVAAADVPAIRPGGAHPMLASVAPDAAARAPAEPALALTVGNEGEVVLEARGADGGLRWAAPIGRAATSRPAPLRP